MTWIILLYYKIRYPAQWYFVTATGLDANDARMFASTSIRAYCGVLPLYAFMEYNKKEFGWKTCVILSYQKMTDRQAETYRTEGLNFTVIK